MHEDAPEAIVDAVIRFLDEGAPPLTNRRTLAILFSQPLFCCFETGAERRTAGKDPETSSLLSLLGRAGADQRL